MGRLVVQALRDIGRDKLTTQEEEKGNKMLPDSLKQKFNESINNIEIYTTTNFNKNLPRNIDGFFFSSAEEKLDFKFIEIGIKTGLQSEIKRFLDGSEISENIETIIFSTINIFFGL